MTTTQMQQQPRRGIGLLVVGLVVWVGILLAGIIALFAGVGGGGAATYAGRWGEREFRSFGDGDHKIAMIEITGEILPGRGADTLFSTGGMAADDWLSQIEQAGEDDSVKGVILRLDTPGGAVVPSDQIFNRVKALAADKPVVALMEDTAASGGYYIAAGARHIVANRSTITGSIGVIAMFPNLEGTADKLGYRTIVIKSGKLKDIGSPFRDMTKEERRLLQRLIDTSYGQFVDAVAEGRKLDRERVLGLADGRIYSGVQAVDAGLVDELGGLEEAVKFVRGAASLTGGERVVIYTPPSIGLGDALFGLRGGGIGRQVREAVSGAREDLTGIPRRPGLHYLWLG